MTAGMTLNFMAGERSGYAGDDLFVIPTASFWLPDAVLVLHLAVRKMAGFSVVDRLTATYCAQQVPNRRARMDRLSQSSDWQNIGALKRELIEMWIGERNRFAERVVRDMRK